MARFTPVGVNFMVRGFGTGQRQLQVLNRSIIGLGRAGRISATGVGLMGTAMIAATAAIGASVGVITGSTSAAMDLEDAMTGVLKTTEGLGDRFEELTPLGKQLLNQFRDLSMEIPFTSSELLKIAEIGGQIGIAEEDLLDFTRIIADMGVSTDLSIQQAAFALGRFSSVMDTTREDMRRVGDTIVWLGNTFPATESEISAFLPRIAAMGKMFNISEADLLGMAGALAQLGINAQAGSTAIQRTFSRIQLAIAEGGEEFELLAKVMRTTTDELEKNFAERPMEVFKRFILALRDMGSDSTLVLRALQLSTARYLPALQGLAATYFDKFIPAVEGANVAWEENVALAEEAGKFYATTRSAIKTMMNVIRNMLETVGLPLIKWMKEWIELNKPILMDFGKRLPDILKKDVIPAVKELGEGMMEFFRFIKDNREPLTQIVKGLAALMIITKVTGAVTGLTTSFGFLKSLGIVRLITGIMGALTTLAGGLSRLWVLITRGRGVVWGLRAALIELPIAAGPVVAILLKVGGAILSVKTAIILAIVAIGAYVTNLMGFRDRVDEFVASLTGIPGKIRDAILNPLKSLGEEGESAGRALIAGLQTGVRDSFPLFGMDFRQGLQNIVDLLPGSEPADPSSPLTGLAKRGKAILDEIRTGVKAGAPKLIAETKNIMTDLADIIIAFGEDFERAGEQLLSVYLNRGLSQGALRLMDTAEKIMSILTVSLANPLTAELRRTLIEQFNIINVEVARGFIEWSDIVNALTRSEMELLQDMMLTGGLTAGEAFALGLEIAFPRFQKIIGIYIEHMNAILSFFGLNIGAPKVEGVGGRGKGLPGAGGIPGGIGGKGGQRPGLGLGDLIDSIGESIGLIVDEWKDTIKKSIGAGDDEDLGGVGDKIKEGGEDMKEAAEVIAETMSRLEFLSQLGDSIISAADFFAEKVQEAFEAERDYLREFLKLTEEVTARLFESAGELSLALSPLEFLPAAAEEFFRVGQFMVGVLKGRILDPLKSTMDSIDAEIRNVLQGEQAAAELESERLERLKEEGVDVERLLELEAERVRLQEKYNKEQKKLLNLEQMRSRFNFLQEQLNLVKFIRQQGLDPAKVLGGIQLGEGADPAAFLTKAMDALKRILARVNSELREATSLFGELKDPSGLETTKDVSEEISKTWKLLKTLLPEKGAVEGALIAFTKGAKNFDMEILALIEHYFGLGDLLNTLLPLEQERLKIQEDLRKESEALLQLEEKRAQLDLLQQQIDLIETLRELGLDPSDILGGIELGLQADMESFLDLMLRLLDETIKAMDDELQISSPSKVFFQRGKMMIAGLIKGAESMIPALEATVASSMRQVAVMPMMAAASPVASQHNTFNTTINSDMEMAQFEQRVLRVVRSDLR